MAGREVKTLYPPLPPAPAGEPALEVMGLAGRGLAEVSLTLAKGEILGVGGLAGHGHRELFFMLFGAMKPTAGTVKVAGRRCGYGRRGTRSAPASASRSSRKIARPRACCCRCRSRST